MKKIFLLVTFIVLGTTLLQAQERDQDRIQDQDRTKVVMIAGEMLEVRERAQIRLQNKLTLNDGTVLSPDGTFKTANREKMRLRKDECLDSDGIRYRNEYQYRFKIQQENKGLTQAQIQERNQNRVHYLLVDGEVMQIRTRSQNRLEQQLNLESGAVVNPDGTYQTGNGNQLRLKDGECLNMNGKMFKNSFEHRKMMNKQMMNKQMMKKKNMPNKSTFMKKSSKV